MKNKFRVEDDIAYIEINYKNRTAFETKVDASDLKRLLAFDVLWSVSYQKKCDRMYITTSVWMEGKSKTFYLHRFVTDAPKGKVVDHMNHNTLDNRKIN